jgi:hypothetical protein
LTSSSRSSGTDQNIRVKRGFGEENGVLLGSDTKLVVEGVVPDLLHIIPVGDDTMLDRVL